MLSPFSSSAGEFTLLKKGPRNPARASVCGVGVRVSCVRDRVTPPVSVHENPVCVTPCLGHARARARFHGSVLSPHAQPLIFINVNYPAELLKETTRATSKLTRLTTVASEMLSRWLLEDTLAAHAAPSRRLRSGPSAWAQSTRHTQAARPSATNVSPFSVLLL